MYSKIFLNSKFRFSRKCQNKSVCVRRCLRCRILLVFVAYAQMHHSTSILTRGLKFGLARVFIYIHTMCMRATKILLSLPLSLRCSMLHWVPKSDLLLLSYRCIVTINALWLFLTVPWVGLQCVVVVFPDHTHLLFADL